MLVVKTARDAAQYLDLADAEAAELTALADLFGRAKLLSHCRLLEDALFAMQKSNAVKRIIAELTLVRLCDPRLDTSPEGLLARIERLEDGYVSEVRPAPVPQKAEPAAQKPQETKKQTAPSVAPAPVKAEPAAQEPAGKQTAQKAGGRVLTRMKGFVNCVERIRRTNTMVASFLTDARAYLDEQGRVVVLLPNSFAEMMLERQGGRDILRHALCLELQREVSDKDLLIEIATEGAAKNDTVIDDILSAANNGE
jgi:DNA polymerase-3 subunit gamma/tau